MIFWFRARLAVKLAIIISPPILRPIIQSFLREYWLQIEKTLEEARQEHKS